MTKEEYDELDKRYGGLKEDPDDLGVVPTTEQPEWCMKLFDDQG
jgi:hypothetical protein